MTVRLGVKSVFKLGILFNIVLESTAFTPPSIDNAKNYSGIDVFLDIS